MDDEDDVDATHIHSGDAVLQDALAGIFDALRDLAATPQTRELRARAESYRLTMERWTNAPPSKAQRDALRELVLALHEKADTLREAMTKGK